MLTSRLLRWPSGPLCSLSGTWGTGMLQAVSTTCRLSPPQCRHRRQILRALLRSGGDAGTNEFSPVWPGPRAAIIHRHTFTLCPKGKGCKHTGEVWPSAARAGPEKLSSAVVAATPNPNHTSKTVGRSETQPPPSHPFRSCSILKVSEASC